MAGLGFVITLLDLVFRTSRIQDVFFRGLHLPLIVMIFGTGALLLSGRLFLPLFAKIGRILALLTVLMLFSVGVSVWPGGAYQYLMNNWAPALPTFFLLCGFVRTFRQLKTSLVTAACGYAAIAYMGLVLSNDIGVGRLGIKKFTFGNSNDLAMVLLFGLPLSVWALLDKRTSRVARLFLAGGLICAVPVFFRTGSRAGVVALAGVALYTLLRQNMATRIRVVLVALVVIPTGIAVAPSRVLDRYATMVNAFMEPPDPIANPAEEGEEKVDEAAVDSAVASAEGRLALLRRSLEVTFENPVLGVGPGMFVVAENEIAVEEGRQRGFWKASHNMFTQISSEAGLPAAGLYVYLIVLVWKVLSRAEKLDRRRVSFAPDLRRVAVALKTTTIVFILCGLTLSIGYGPFLMMLCGWAIAIDRFVAAAALQAKAEREQAERAQAGERAPDPVPAFARNVLPAGS